MAYQFEIVTDEIEKMNPVYPYLPANPYIREFEPGDKHYFLDGVEVSKYDFSLHAQEVGILNIMTGGRINMNPTIGRIVLYCTADEPWQTFPAIVTVVPEEGATEIGLIVFTPDGPQYKPDVEYSETAAANTWRWPSVPGATTAS